VHPLARGPDLYYPETIARSAGLFCRKVLVTNQADLPATFAERARIFGIRVVAGPDLPRLGEILVALTPRSPAQPSRQESDP